MSVRKNRSPRPAKRGGGYGVRGCREERVTLPDVARHWPLTPAPLSPSFRRGEGTEVHLRLSSRALASLGELQTRPPAHRGRLEKSGCTVERKFDLGGTLVCDRAITAGSIDVYPEYSGTALTAILHRPASSDRAAVMKIVGDDYARRGLEWSPPLGFENTF